MAGAVALTLTWTLADHAQTGVQTWLAVPATSLHLLAMSLWLGGLIVLAACVVIPAGRREPTRAVSLEPALPRFSLLAQISFAVIAVTGLYLSWRQVGTWGALGGTVFGRLLLGKLAVVLAVLALAAGARRFVRRRGREPLGIEAVPSTALRGCAARSRVRSCSGSPSCRSRPSWSTPPRPATATHPRWTARFPFPPPRRTRSPSCEAARSR
ncbi:copper resistance D family protein [Streptosporangium lutulentum]